MAGRFQEVRDSDDPRSSAPGIGSSFISPTFEQCPYNENHFLTKKNTPGHIMECRKIYVQKCNEKGEIPVTLKCKYNINHIVYAPEIQFHEKHCKNGDFVPTYLLHAEPFKDSPGYDPAFQALESTQAELKKLHCWCPMPVTLSDLKKLIATYQNFEGRWNLVLEEPKEEEKEAAASANKEGAGAAGYENDSTLGTPTPGPTVKVDERSEDDDWESDTNEPNFSNLQNANVLRKPMFTHPPGLTKREGEEFVKFHTKWATGLGITKVPQVTGVKTEGKDEEDTSSDIPKELTVTTEPGEKEVEEDEVDKEAEAEEDVHQVPENYPDDDFEEEGDDDEEEDFDDDAFIVLGNSRSSLKLKMVKQNKKAVKDIGDPSKTEMEAALMNDEGGSGRVDDDNFRGPESKLEPGTVSKDKEQVGDFETLEGLENEQDEVHGRDNKSHEAP